MLQTRTLFVMLWLPAFVTLSSCEDTSEKTQAAIIGRWELTKALRNQQETGTLEGVYFDFSADGKMQTNLPVGAEEPVDYEVDNTGIIQKTAHVIHYKVVSTEDSTLVLQLEMRGMIFEMFLRRAEEPVPTEDTLDSLDDQE